MELYVEESGTPGAPTLVFLHGSGIGTWMWEEQVRGLQDFHCVNLDLPGHGKSNHIEYVSLADTADQIAALIRARGTHGRATLVGMSFGGYVALTALARHADLIDKAVVSGVTDRPLPNRGAVLLQTRLLRPFMKSRGFVRMQAQMMRLPADVLDVYSASMIAMTRTAYDRIIAEVVDYHLPEVLSSVSVPTLIAAGSAEMKPMVAAAAAIPRTMPNARGVIAPGLHHAWNGENPALFTAMIRAWVTGASLPEGLQRVNG